MTRLGFLQDRGELLNRMDLCFWRAAANKHSGIKGFEQFYVWRTLVSLTYIALFSIRSAAKSTAGKNKLPRLLNSGPSDHLLFSLWAYRLTLAVYPRTNADIQPDGFPIY